MHPLTKLISTGDKCVNANMDKIITDYLTKRAEWFVKEFEIDRLIDGADVDMVFEAFELSPSKTECKHKLVFLYSSSGTVDPNNYEVWRCEKCEEFISIKKPIPSSPKTECCCGFPNHLGVVHRKDKPCWIPDDKFIPDEPKPSPKLLIPGTKDIECVMCDHVPSSCCLKISEVSERWFCSLLCVEKWIKARLVD